METLHEPKESFLRALLIGDVIGDPGLDILDRHLPSLLEELQVDFTAANGENAAAGFGLTAIELKRLFAAGIDVVTSGNHIWEKREFWPVLDSEERILRPFNYPEGSPGKGFVKINKQSKDVNVLWVVLNLQGREHMSPLDCPFKAYDHFERELGGNALKLASLLDTDGKLPGSFQEKPIILVDFHAESTKEKEALAYYLDGRADLVAGTHTHVQTADERILPGGTAYITDLGMTGCLDSIIGMNPEVCIDRVIKQVPYRMEVAVPKPGCRLGIQGVIVDFDKETRKALSVKRLTKEYLL